MSAYSFQQQLAAGESGEAVLDSFFAQWYEITPATMTQQRQGIDRIFVDRAARITVLVEYKTDWTAAKTGNAFVETVSVDTANKRGWAYTSQATWLLYFVPGDDLCYALPFARLRRNLSRWLRLYPERAIPNKGYKTHGILVPLFEFERIAQAVLSL